MGMVAEMMRARPRLFQAFGGRFGFLLLALIALMLSTPLVVRGWAWDLLLGLFASVVLVACLCAARPGRDSLRLGLILGLVFAINVEAIRATVSNVLNISIFPPELFLMSALPSRVDPSEVVLVVLLSLGLTFLATLYPAWRAARLDPIEGLNQ